MQLYKEKLTELKSQLETNGVVSQNDILSLESFFDKQPFSSKMNVGLLSNSESATGVKDILNIIDYELSLEDQVIYKTKYDEYIVDGAKKLDLMDITKLIKTAKSTADMYNEIESDIVFLLSSKFVQNVALNLLNIELNGKFIKMQDIPLEVLPLIDSSWMFMACGNNTEEYDRMNAIIAKLSEVLKLTDNPDYGNNQLLQSFHTLKELNTYLKSDLVYKQQEKKEKCIILNGNITLDLDVYNFARDFAHTDTQPKIGIGLLLTNIVNYFLINQDVVYKTIIERTYEINSVKLVTNESKNSYIETRKNLLEELATSTFILNNITVELKELFKK